MTKERAQIKVYHAVFCVHMQRSLREVTGEQGHPINRICTHCQVKLPVMPSFRRSLNERCRLGPEPLPICGDCKCVPAGRFGDEVAEFSLLLLPPPRLNCAPDRFTSFRMGLPMDDDDAAAEAAAAPAA